MRQTEIMPMEMKVLMNHIYELQKGVRQMVLFRSNMKPVPPNGFAVRTWTSCSSQQVRIT